MRTAAKGLPAPWTTGYHPRVKTPQRWPELSPHIVAIAQRAGEAILKVIQGDLDVRAKADASPITAADEAADAIIVAALKELTPDIPVVTEERTDSWGLRAGPDEPFWLVDPLDGTRELVAGRDEYTVNIALIEDRVPVLGVVHTPAAGETHFGWGRGQAFRQREGKPDEAISVRRPPAGSLIAVASRSHRDAETDAFLREHGISETRAIGSSLKFCLIAEGKAHIYPRLGPTMEWDIAAGHIIAEEAGAKVLSWPELEKLKYNKQDLHNPNFIVGKQINA